MATSAPTPITPPRVPLIDPRTGLIDRAWYMFFLSLFQTAETVADSEIGPDVVSLAASLEAALQQATQDLQTQPVSVVEQMQPLLDAIAMRLDTLPRQELGTMAALQQANVPWLTFDTTPQSVPTDVGTMAWDGGTTLNIQMTANVLQRVGETEFVYVKASATITKGQLCYHTGSVGSSGVITAAPTPIGLADPNQIVGVAAESIALNGFGLIQISGDLRGFNTTGNSVGETWADGDPLYYNPAYVGSMTKVKPSAPNQKSYIGEVINAGSGGSGSMHIRIVQGSVLGGTDSNVQFSALADKDLIQYDAVAGYWKNVPPTAISIGTATNLAGGAAGSVPYQTAASTTTFLPIGTAGQVLKVNSGATAPEWVSGAALTKVDDTNVTLTLGGSATTALVNAASLTLGWTGVLAATRGGTGQSSYTTGDILYASSSTALSKLAGVATGNVLISGGVGVAPSWGKVGLTTHITGTLAVGNGGTGLTTLPADRIPYGNGTSAFQSSANLSFDGTSLKVGAKATPTLTGGQAQLVGDCVIFAGDTAVGSPYTQSLRVDIVWNNWGSNNVIGLVEVAIACRQWANTSGGAFGWAYATNTAGSATFSTFTTTGVTATQGALTAASGGNYTLRLTFAPTNQTDFIGYTIRIPTMSGGTGSAVSSISATLV